MTKKINVQTADFTLTVTALTIIDYTNHLKCCPLSISLKIAVHAQKFWKCYKLTHYYLLLSVVV
jgi:hypothetical protein